MNARTLLNNPVLNGFSLRFQMFISNLHLKTYKTSKVFNTNI